MPSQLTKSAPARAAQVPALLFGLLCALAFATAAPAYAQDAGSNPLTEALGALGFAKAHPPQMPDFVVRSRPDPSEVHFIPLGAPPPDPSDKALTRAQIEAEESTLAALRRRDELRGGRRPVAIKVNSAAGPLIAPKRKAKPTCRITCKIDLTKVSK